MLSRMSKQDKKNYEKSQETPESSSSRNFALDKPVSEK